MAVLSLTIEQFTADRLEGRCTEWGTFPKPGSFIQLTTASGSHFYVQVDSVRYTADDAKGLLLGMTPVAGDPDTRIQYAEQITQAQYMQATHGHGVPQIPLRTSELMLDLADLGKVVYVKPTGTGVHKALMQSFHHAGLPMVIVDPVGLDFGDIGAKEQVFSPKGLQLSIQDVGVSHFIQWVVEALPPSAQARASEELIKTIPPTADFIPLQYFVDHPVLQGSALSSAILHPLYHFHHHALFASKAKQALNLNQLNGVHHFNLSTLPPELMAIAYEGLLRSLYRHGLSAQTQVVLVAPEVAPEFARTFTQLARNRVFLMSTQLAPWQALVTDSWNEVRHFGEEGIEIRGEVTHGLNVFVSAGTFREQVQLSQAVSALQPEEVPETTSMISKVPPVVEVTPPALPQDSVPVPMASAMPALEAPAVAAALSPILDTLAPVSWEAISMESSLPPGPEDEEEGDINLEIPEPSEASELAMQAALVQADLDLPVESDVFEEAFLPELEMLGEGVESLGPALVDEAPPEFTLLETMLPPDQDVGDPSFLSAPPLLEEPVGQSSSSALMPPGDMMDIGEDTSLEKALDTSLAAPFSGLDFLFEDEPVSYQSVSSTVSEPLPPQASSEAAREGDDNAWALEALLESPEPVTMAEPLTDVRTHSPEAETPIDTLDFDNGEGLWEEENASSVPPISGLQVESVASTQLSDLLAQATSHQEAPDLTQLPEISMEALSVDLDMDASLVADPDLTLDPSAMSLDLDADFDMSIAPLASEARMQGDNSNAEALEALGMLDNDIPSVVDLGQSVQIDPGLPPIPSYSLADTEPEDAFAIQPMPTLQIPESLVDPQTMSLDLEEDVFEFEDALESCESASPEAESQPLSLEAVQSNDDVPERAFDFDFDLDAAVPESSVAPSAPEFPEDLPEAVEPVFDLDFSFDAPELSIPEETPQADLPPGAPMLPDEEETGLTLSLDAEDLFADLEGLEMPEPRATSDLKEQEADAAPVMDVQEVFPILEELEETRLKEQGMPSLPDEVLPLPGSEPSQDASVAEAVPFADVDELALLKEEVASENLADAFDMSAVSEAPTMLSPEESSALEQALDAQLAMLEEPSSSTEESLALESLEFELTDDLPDPLPVRQELATGQIPLKESETETMTSPDPVTADIQEDQEDLLALLDVPVMEESSALQAPETSLPEMVWEEAPEEDLLALDFELPDESVSLPPQPAASEAVQRVTPPAENAEWDLDFDLDLPDSPIGTDGASEDNLLPDFAWEEVSEGAAASAPGASAEEPIPIYKNLVDPTAPGEFEAGQQVMHQRYGTGVIKRVIVMNDNQIILNVVFDSVGKRLLDPRLTQLEKVG